MLDLKTRQVSMLSGSEGLYSPIGHPTAATVDWINYGTAALFGLVAAAFWWQSTRVKVPPQTEIPEHGFAEAQIIVYGVEFLASAHLQARWNRWAVAATGISVGFRPLL